MKWWTAYLHSLTTLYTDVLHSISYFHCHKSEHFSKLDFGNKGTDVAITTGILQGQRQVQYTGIFQRLLAPSVKKMLTLPIPFHCLCSLFCFDYVALSV